MNAEAETKAGERLGAEAKAMIAALGKYDAKINNAIERWQAMRRLAAQGACTPRELREAALALYAAGAVAANASITNVPKSNTEKLGETCCNPAKPRI